MKARKKTIKLVSSDISVLKSDQESSCTLVSMSYPEERKSALMIEGENNSEKVDALMHILHDQKKMI